jgi:hypothetical protein
VLSSIVDQDCASAPSAGPHSWPQDRPPFCAAESSLFHTILTVPGFSVQNLVVPKVRFRSRGRANRFRKQPGPADNRDRLPGRGRPNGEVVVPIVAPTAGDVQGRRCRDCNHRPHGWGCPGEAKQRLQSSPLRLGPSRAKRGRSRRPIIAPPAGDVQGQTGGATQGVFAWRV